MRLTALVLAIIGPVCIAAGHLLLPLARRADGQVLADGRVLVTSPEAGMWSIQWGWIAGLSLLTVSGILFVWSSFTERDDHAAEP